MPHSSSIPESCPDCGFIWDDVAPDEVSARVTSAVGLFSILLIDNAALTHIRIEPERWSIVEYGAHLRDVLLLVRDRVILTALEEVPHPFPLYREERVHLGLYAEDTAASIAEELIVAARLFNSAFNHLYPAHAERTLIYSYPLGAERSMGWTGAQVVHECEHHFDDVRHNADVLARS